MSPGIYLPRNASRTPREGFSGDSLACGRHEDAALGSEGKAGIFGHAVPATAPVSTGIRPIGNGRPVAFSQHGVVETGSHPHCLPGMGETPGAGGDLREGCR